MQVEGGLGAGEVAEGLGPSYVEGLGGAEGLLLGCVVGELAVEVEGAPLTRVPSDEELQLIREVIDPRGLRSREVAN